MPVRSPKTAVQKLVTVISQLSTSPQRRKSLIKKPIVIGQNFRIKREGYNPKSYSSSMKQNSVKFDDASPVASFN